MLTLVTVNKIHKNSHKNIVRVNYSYNKDIISNKSLVRINVDDLIKQNELWFLRDNMNNKYTFKRHVLPRFTGIRNHYTVSRYQDTIVYHWLWYYMYYAIIRLLYLFWTQKLQYRLIRFKLLAPKSLSIVWLPIQGCLWMI